METLETIEYRGYTIEIHHDDWAENPFSDCDFLPGITVREYGRKGHSQQYSYSDWEIEPTREQIAANADKICALFGCKSLFYFRYASGCYDCDIVDDITHALTDYSEQGESELVEVLNLLGYAADFTPSAFSWGYAIAVLTPKFYEVTGLPNTPEANRDALAHALELFEDWATGSVYTYTIADQDGNETDYNCGGFFGYDHEKSGLLEYAHNAIDHEVNQRREIAAQRAKLTFSLFPNVAHAFAIESK